MIDNFIPLATYSGVPHLSNEQRELFNRQKIKNMNTISPLFDNENYTKFFGSFNDFQKWRVLDLVAVYPSDTPAPPPDYAPARHPCREARHYRG